jgi:hypothetical protein
MENLTFAFLHKPNWDSAVGVLDRIRARRSEIVHDSRDCQEICLFQTGHFIRGLHPANYLIRTADSFYTYPVQNFTGDKTAKKLTLITSILWLLKKIPSCSIHLSSLTATITEC